MTIQELHDIRDKMKKQLYKRDSVGKTVQISVAMGDKGLEKGAKDIYHEFAKLIEEKNIGDHVIVRQTGSMGFEGNEPVVEVAVKGQKHIIYGKVKLDEAKAIVENHVVAGKIVDSLVIG